MAGSALSSGWRTVRLWLTVMVALATALAMVVAPEPAGAQQEQRAEPAEVAPELQAQAEAAERSGEPLVALAILTGQPDLAPISGDRDAVVAALQVAADVSRAEFEAGVRAQGGALDALTVVNHLWINNMLVLELPAAQASAQLNALAVIPAVDRLIPSFELSVIEPVEEPGEQIVGDVTYGIDTIEADRVWDELGITGTGVRVATLDTGVDISHPDLAGKMVTDDPGDPTYPGGWMEFDASGNLIESQPHDSAFHGTHVAGTVQGGGTSGVSIGVAPDSGMMHGLVIPGGSGTFPQVAAGMQWAIDPVDADGNPAGEPADVVNMSLGAAGYHDAMIAPTQNMVAAGTFPSFSIGNEDPFGNCGVGEEIGSGSPGNVYEAVGVGATDINDNVAGFSCGEVVFRDDWASPPADWPDSYIKPDISAPGVNTYSASAGGGYRRLSGTSMAAPHVAGTAALMLAAAPELSVEEMLDTLADTSFWDDRYSDERPDTRYGWGRINAFEATAVVAIDSGVTGTVTDAASGDPIEDATVAVIETGSSTSTDDDGDYTIRLDPGTYTLEASAFAYETATATVVVEPETFTEVNFALSQGPTGTIAGTVTFSASGEGVPGVEVCVQGVPVDLCDTTDLDGNYEITGVPEGTYMVTAEAAGFPDPPSVEVTVTAGETAIADFVLDPPPETVGILGDHSGLLGDFLDSQGIDSEEIAWGDDYGTYPTIIVNQPGDPGEDVFTAFLAATDASETGVVFLDSDNEDGNGIWLLHTYLDNPSERGSGFATAIPYLYYEKIAEHPIVDEWEIGEEIVLETDEFWHDYAWFDGYTGEGREVIADAGRGDTGILGRGIGVQERDTNRHALLSMHAVTLFTEPSLWTDDGAQLMLNSIDWVARERGEDYPLFVLSDLEVEPDVVLSGEPVTVSVNVTNVGTAEGDYTATLFIDGEVEAETTVTLGPGETENIEWTVTREELGTYEVRVGNLTDEFTVRAPDVDLTVWEVQGVNIGFDPDPMAGANVWLVHEGDLHDVGETDENGQLTFPSIDADEELTIVVQRDATEDHPYAYVLSRPERIDDDVEIVIAPRTLADPVTEQQSPWDQSIILDLDLHEVHQDHQGWTYLRHSEAEPFGFAVQAAPVVATIGSYDAKHVHAIPVLERDWWAASDTLTDLAWLDPTNYEHDFGGPASVELSVTQLEGTQFRADWSALDAYGHAFEVMLESELRPFVEVPEAAILEEVTDHLRGEAPNEAEVILRLFDPSGDAVHAGGISWDERSVVRDLADLDDPVEPGQYTLSIEIDADPYVPGELYAEASWGVTAPSRSIDPDVIAPGDAFDVTVTFGAPDGAFSVRRSRRLVMPVRSGSATAGRSATGQPRCPRPMTVMAPGRSRLRRPGWR